MISREVEWEIVLCSFTFCSVQSGVFFLFTAYLEHFCIAWWRFCGMA
jgi:hypothetical protein